MAPCSLWIHQMLHFTHSWNFDHRFETVDMTSRLLIPIIVLQNHNRYNILNAGHNYSIDIQAIEREVCLYLYSVLKYLLILSYSILVMPTFSMFNFLLLLDKFICILFIETIKQELSRTLWKMWLFSVICWHFSEFHHDRIHVL